jgi:hypothetical protein
MKGLWYREHWSGSCFVRSNSYQRSWSLPSPSRVSETKNMLKFVDIFLKGGEIVIRPARKYDLSELLAGITSENIHGEAFMDEPVGQERL